MLDLDLTRFSCNSGVCATDTQSFIFTQARQRSEGVRKCVDDCGDANLQLQSVDVPNRSEVSFLPLDYELGASKADVVSSITPGHPRDTSPERHEPSHHPPRNGSFPLHTSLLLSPHCVPCCVLLLSQPCHFPALSSSRQGVRGRGTCPGGQWQRHDWNLGLCLQTLPRAPY